MLEKLRNSFVKHGRLQLLSVFLAIIFWFLVHSGQTVKQRLTFPIRYINLPKHLVFRSDPPTNLQVNLIGSLHRLRSLNNENIFYPVDLINAEKGRQSIDIDASNLRLPIDVQWLSSRPRRLDFELVELMKKEIPVEILFVGQPADGYVVSKVAVSPNPIQILGPPETVELLNSLQLEVNIEGKSEAFSTSVLTRLKQPQTKTIDSVLVDIEFSRLNVEKIFEEVPVKAQGQPASGARVKLQPETARVTLKGSESEITGLGDQIDLFVPVEGLQKGRYRVRGKLQISEQIRVVSMEPESFIVEVLAK